MITTQGKTRLIGIIGAVFVLFSYYFFSVPPSTELPEVVERIKLGMLLNVAGAIMVIYYIAKR